MKLRLIALLALAACQADPSAPPPGGELQPDGVLYQGAPWTQESEFGATPCGGRRSLPGCSGFPEPSLMAAAIDGRRLVAVMERDRLAGIAGGWDLLVSEDLGTTVRRFPLERLEGAGGPAELHLLAGRIFLLVPALDGSPARGGARLHELDPSQGTVTVRGEMSAVTAIAGPDGTLTSVDFARDRPPQSLAVTRFDPRSNRITRDELPCPVAGCAPGSLAWPFLSSDGDSFDQLVAPTDLPDRSCLLSVRRSTRAVTSECFPRPPRRNLWPISSMDGGPFDFQLSFVDGDEDILLVAVDRHWLATGTPQRFGYSQLHSLGAGLLAFSPSAFTADDTRLLRLRAGGKMQQTTLTHDGCLNLGPFVGTRDCPRPVWSRTVAGDQLLLITQRDEFSEQSRSRQRFEVRRLTAPFTDFSY
jgi:hypothetical protein